MKSYAPAPAALEWQPISLAHKERYATILKKSPQRSADRFFANLYIWNEVYHQEIAFGEDTAFIRFGKANDYHYLPPVGGDLQTAAALLLASEPALSFAAATEAEAEWLLAAYPGTFSVTEARDFADYLYDATALANLAGKKLHAKRNHINAFTAAHDWMIRPLTPDDLGHCLQIFDGWASMQAGASVKNERRATERAFAAFDELELEGAILCVDGKTAAFTVGSVSGDTLDVHFEKALPDLAGAYPVINREFVRMMLRKHPDLALVNREDDMGLENLRRAKLSYRPALLLRKFTLTKKEVGQI